MTRNFIYLLFLGLFFGCSSEKTIEKVKQKTIDAAEVQFSKIGKLYESKRIPRTLKNGDLFSVNPYDWTSGFYAGSLWYLYELTENPQWKDQAVAYTEILDTIQWYSGNHDVGFMINCSYGNGYRIGGKEHYKQVLVNAAESLSQRFNSNVGQIKSWNYREAWDGVTEWFYPVIIDNMMNLELLFEASAISGNSFYRDLAIIHADNTMRDHYRPDFSSYHVVDYDTITGHVLDKATCQGFADNSSWARGQAWGLYGYVITYRATKDEKYLNFAINIADYMMSHPSIPEDKIPYWDYHIDVDGYQAEWDYQDGVDYFYRDVSAATITASALIELATYVSQEESNQYVDYARDIIMNVSTPNYMATEDEDNYFILKHSVGSMPHGSSIDTPANYADYYYLEALTRLINYETDKDHVLPENTFMASLY
ncbi:MAG: glycoside hydrolase family 88 protein [Flavobacteriaceae bacterium]|nr:glycoside hydrolase family 88 protein [Flavobacteriaceae bacterium]